jgi:uncharacterized protein (TIGR03437 family)
MMRLWSRGCLFAVGHWVVLAASGPAAILPAFFGIDQNNLGSPWPPTAAAGTPAPAAALRLWDDGAKWTNLETCNPRNASGFSPADPNNPCYTWSNLDTWVRSRAPGAGMDVLYTLGGTPGWATSQIAPPVVCETAGTYSCLPPIDVDKAPGSGLGDGTDATWMDFLTALVTRYKGQIQFYELWNEPDSTTFWAGTNAQFLRMMNDAAATIRPLDSAARILSPSFHGPTAATWFATFLGGGGAADFDIVNFHGRGEGTANIQPEAILSTYAQAETVMAAYALTARPFWDDEAGWLENQVTDPDMQAAYVARSLILRASLGLARFYWYQWDSASPYGLQGTIGGTAYVQAARWLIGATISSCPQNGTFYSCPVTPAGGGSDLILWNASQTCAAQVCTTVFVTVDPRFVQYLDVAGNTFPIQNNSVPVGAKPILLQSAAGNTARAAAATMVTVKDSGGSSRAATLFYALPQQIAFLTPAGAAVGPATVTVTSGDGTVSAATVQILTVAPGLFSANENGQGVAAAVAVEGQSASLVYSCGSAPGSCAAVPIGLNQTVLELYGTGIRGHSASGVTCTVGGVSVPVLYAGAQGQYSGLDQVNVSLPPTIANRSQLSIVLTVDGQNSNAVTVSTGAAAGN